MFGHPASMGHGLNLQGSAADVCFLSPTWDFELFDQFVSVVDEGRDNLDRQGVLKAANGGVYTASQALALL